MWRRRRFRLPNQRARFGQLRSHGLHRRSRRQRDRLGRHSRDRVVLGRSNPGIDRLRFYIDGERLLTDYQAPWRFTLPTDRWADGDKLVEVEAVMRDDFASERAGLNLNFANGPEAPRQNDRQFTPSTGTPPEPGKPFVLAAVGDGASGETNADSVRDLIQSWNPNLFLYFGDVYETGTVAEFHNWGRQYFGGLRDITNPIVGDHEYEGMATGRGLLRLGTTSPTTTATTPPAGTSSPSIRASTSAGRAWHGAVRVAAQRPPSERGGVHDRLYAHAAVQHRQERRDQAAERRLAAAQRPRRRALDGRARPYLSALASRGRQRRARFE